MRACLKRGPPLPAVVGAGAASSLASQRALRTAGSKPPAGQWVSCSRSTVHAHPHTDQRQLSARTLLPTPGLSRLAFRSDVRPLAGRAIVLLAHLGLPACRRERQATI
jgi:hypothetical protein